MKENKFYAINILSVQYDISVTVIIVSCYKPTWLNYNGQVQCNFQQLMITLTNKLLIIEIFYFIFLFGDYILKLFF